MAVEENGRSAKALADVIWAAVDGDPAFAERLSFTGDGALASAFAVTDLAAASIGAAALSVAALVGDIAGEVPPVQVDRRSASRWFGWSLRPIGWTMPPPWDPIAGDYRTADGWIRLHTNAPRHRDAALAVLDVPGDRAAVERAVALRGGDELEVAVVAAGGCAAVMRSVDAWERHPQGRAVRAEPLVMREVRTGRSFLEWRPTRERPLAGLKVLDLTRVLAGPVATRFLAGYGADVLRVDPPGWDEPGVVPEVTLGKRCARLNLTAAADRETFEQLLADADVLVHGYRPGALDRLGLGPDVRWRLAPTIIEVTLDAYGWSGPWAGRRGFDSLVQMSAGIAEAGMGWKGADRPTPLPVQALDHATGYLMAAAAVQAVCARLRGDGCTASRLSLARTASLLVETPVPDARPLAPETPEDLAPLREATSWGDAHRLRAPVSTAGAEMRWGLPASKLGSTQAVWRSGKRPDSFDASQVGTTP